MKFFYLIFLLTITLSSYSQTEVISAVSHNIKEIEQKTYVLDVSNVHTDIIENLKKELTGWEDKIYEVILDTTHERLYITHTKLFNDIEFIEVLGKYNMSKKMVISYY